MKKHFLTACIVIICIFCVGCSDLSTTDAKDKSKTYELMEHDTELEVTEDSEDADASLEEMLLTKNYMLEGNQLIVTGDDFTLNAPVSIFNHTEDNIDEYFTSFSERTENSLAFIQDYIKENAPECYDEAHFNQFINIQLHDDGQSYYYELTDDAIMLHTGRYFVHRDVVYILALMNPKWVEWQHFGISWYLGTTVNPYTEVFGIIGYDGGNIKDAVYYDNYIQHGGHLENLTNEDLKILYDCVAYHCLTYGYNWGSGCESGPVYNELYYNGPKKLQKKENEISAYMATSFTAWLAANYGFDCVANHCFQGISFEEAYGVDYQTAYDLWMDYILQNYSE